MATFYENFPFLRELTSSQLLDNANLKKIVTEGDEDPPSKKEKKAESPEKGDAAGSSSVTKKLYADLKQRVKAYQVALKEADREFKEDVVKYKDPGARVTAVLKGLLEMVGPDDKGIALTIDDWVLAKKKKYQEKDKSGKAWREYQESGKYKRIDACGTAAAHEYERIDGMRKQVAAAAKELAEKRAEYEALVKELDGWLADLKDLEGPSDKARETLAKLRHIKSWACSYTQLPKLKTSLGELEGTVAALLKNKKDILKFWNALRTVDEPIGSLRDKAKESPKVQSMLLPIEEKRRSLKSGDQFEEIFYLLEMVGKALKEAPTDKEVKEFKRRFAELEKELDNAIKEAEPLVTVSPKPYAKLNRLSQLLRELTGDDMDDLAALEKQADAAIAEISQVQDKRDKVFKRRSTELKKELGKAIKEAELLPIESPGDKALKEMEGMLDELDGLLADDTDALEAMEMRSTKLLAALDKAREAAEAGKAPRSS